MKNSDSGHFGYIFGYIDPGHISRTIGRVSSTDALLVAYVNRFNGL